MPKDVGQSCIYTAIFVFLVTTMIGCKSLGGKNNNTDEGDDSFPTSFVVITQPSRHHSSTTNQDNVTFAGVCSGSISDLSYSLKRPDGSTSQGSISLSPSWSFDEDLAPGDNLITVEASDTEGASLTDVAVVTYNPLLSIGTTSASPLLVFRGQSAAVTFSSEILDFDGLSIRTVEVVEVDNQRQLIGAVATANDDGIGVDERGLDQIYTAAVVVDASAQSERYYRFSIGVETDSGVETQYSEVVAVKILEPFTQDEINEANDLHEFAAASYATHRTTLDSAEAFRQLAQELRERSEVQTGTVASGEYAVRWTTTSGIKSVFSDFPSGTVGHSENTAANQVSRKFGGSSTCVSEPRAVLLEPFAREYRQSMADRTEEILRRSFCPAYEVVKRKDTQAGVDAFKDLDTFGVVFIYTHGSRTSDRVWFEVDEVYDFSAPFNPFHPRFLELKAGLIGWASHAGNPNLHYLIEPDFIYFYNRNFPERSLVFLASCSSAGDATMALSFIMAGASIYTGFTGTISTWAECIAEAFFTQLVVFGKNTQEARSTARLECGSHDPQHPEARLVSAPQGVELTLVEGCDGYTRMEDNGEWSDGGYNSKYQSHTVYESRDKIVRAWFDYTGNTYILQESERSCVATFSETSFWDEPIRNYSAFGTRSDVYPDMPDDPFNVDPDARYGVIIMEIDPDTQSVDFTIQPEAAYRSSDTWIEYDNWNNVSGQYTDQSDRCPFEGAFAQYLVEHGGLYLTEPDVTITDDLVEGNLYIENERGTARLHFTYSLEND